MPSGHQSFLDKFLNKKSNRLGLFDGPMASSTVALHGLSYDDALHLVERKINRARRAGGTEIRVVHEKGNVKLRKLLLEFLGQTPDVAEFQEDESNPAVVWVKLS